MGLPPAVPFHPGDVLADKYRVQRVVGAGGMGAVVEAYHLDLEQRVALKVMLPEVANRKDLASRFVREARASAKLQSEHIAKVFDVGRLPTSEPYIVMEFLDGEDLASVLRTRGPQPVSTAVDWLLQACEAIAEAHTKGIVHRDLKPSNLFLTRRADGTGLVKVLDFGISKVRSDDGTNEGNLTATSAMLGSPAYMSPEQMRDAKNVDGRTDVWGLGMILFELLAGRPVYQADSVTALIAMISSDPPPSLCKARPEVPVQLETVVLRCLEKDPARRTQNVAELAASLEPFASKDGVASVRRTVRVMRSAGMTGIPTGRPPMLSAAGADEARSVGDGTASTFGVTADGKMPRLRTWMLAPAAVVLLGGATAFWWSARSSSSPAAAAASDAALPSAAPTTIAPASSDIVALPVASDSPAASSSPAASAEPAPVEPVPTKREPSSKNTPTGGSATTPPVPAATTRPAPTSTGGSREQIDLSERR